MDSDDPTKAELQAENERLKRENKRLRSSTTRRALIGGLSTAAAVPLLFGSASAQSSSGTLPAPSDPPLTQLRADRVVLAPRSSALSNPEDGTITYRSDL